MTPRVCEAASDPVPGWAAAGAVAEAAPVPFPCGVALSASLGAVAERPAAPKVVLALERDRSASSPVPATVPGAAAEVCALRAPACVRREGASPATALTRRSGLSSVVERSPRGAEASRLSEEDDDRDSVASSE